MDINTINSSEIIHHIMKYIGENYGFNEASIDSDSIQIIAENGDVVNIYVQVETCED